MFRLGHVEHVSIWGGGVYFKRRGFVLEQVPVRMVHVCVHVLMVFSGDGRACGLPPSDVVKVTVLLRRTNFFLWFVDSSKAL